MAHQRKRRRGWKACDPFCTDKVRKALYNRPNGPHQGKLIMGKTYLSGIDNKCFSRTGRIKKGYRNVPIDLQREFEIEKRQIQQIHNMINPKIKKKKKQKQKEKEKEKQMDKNNNLMLDQKNNEIEKKENNENDNDKKIIKDQYGMIIQSMDELSKKKNETLDDYMLRVRRTTSYHLNSFKNKHQQQKMRKRQKNLEKKLKKQQKQIQEKRLRKKEDKKRRQETRTFHQKITPTKEFIAFGATNDAPPVNLHKLGQQLFGKKVNKQNNKNKNGINLSGLSFGNVIEDRAKQMTIARTKQNYELMKQKRHKQQIENAKKNARRNRSRRTW